jgi:hypothetical protein
VTPRIPAAIRRPSLPLAMSALFSRSSHGLCPSSSYSPCRAPSLGGGTLTVPDSVAAGDGAVIQGVGHAQLSVGSSGGRVSCLDVVVIASAFLV